MADNSTSSTEQPVGVGGFWSGEKLLQNKQVVGDFDEKQLDANAYNLRMGNVLFKTTHTTGDTPGKVLLKNKEPFVIPPGQFAFLLTKEEVCIPKNAMAFISMRTRIKYQGLINVSGFHVDPGYKGKLIYAVYNASPAPVQICEGDSAFKIWFCSLDNHLDSAYTFKGKGIYDIDNELVRGMSREIHSLQAISDKIKELESSMNLKFAEQKPVVEGLKQAWDNITRAIFVAAVIAFLSFVVPIGWGLGKSALPIIEDYISTQLSTQKAAPPQKPPAIPLPQPAPSSRSSP